LGRGGKLILYQGWADNLIAPLNSVNYYKSVVAKIGSKTADGSIRLYMAPGMGHCGGGDGPSVFDMVDPLEQWVEGGRAPDSVIASHRSNGRTNRTRLLCPYPQMAKYKDSGDTDDAANFVCAQP
jgi:feruloyl esterase